MDAKAQPPPRGITVAQAAAMLHYSRATILRMIATRELTAWQPRPGRGRKWLIDEVSLARHQARLIAAAREACTPVQEVLIQGALALY